MKLSAHETPQARSEWHDIFRENLQATTLPSKVIIHDWREKELLGETQVEGVYCH